MVHQWIILHGTQTLEEGQPNDWKNLEVNNSEGKDCVIDYDKSDDNIGFIDLHCTLNKPYAFTCNNKYNISRYGIILV